MTPSKGQMHEHDLDLIASLADGSLDNETEARALVDTCDACQSEYQAQLAALAALRSAPAITPLTDIERASLHRDIWTELRSAPAASEKTPWWYRWTYAAAGLFVLVGLVAVLGQLQSGDSGGETFSEVSSGLDGGDDIRNLYEEPGDTASAPDESDGGDAQQEAGGAPTTMAATESTVPPTTLPEVAEFEAMADTARATAMTQESTTTTTVEETSEDCLESTGLGGHRVLATVDMGHTYLLVVPAGVELTTDTVVTVVDADTCQIVHVED